MVATSLDQYDFRSLRGNAQGRIIAALRNLLTLWDRGDNGQWKYEDIRMIDYARALVDVDQFFGVGSPWMLTCAIYRSRMFSLPEKVKSHVEQLGRSRIAFLLGYCFAVALSRRFVAISLDQLHAVADRTISYGKPEEFVAGFLAFQSELADKPIGSII